MITQKNYEAYLLDYLEGNLEESVVNEFIEFLQQNPHIQKEINAFNQYHLEKEEILFPHKEKLYKNIYDSQTEFDKVSIAYIENELSESEKKKFLNYINQNPEKNKEFILFQKTLLHPDKSIQYPLKNKLLKKSTNKLFLIIRIAAILILLFLVADFHEINYSNISDNNILTENNIIREEISLQYEELKPIPPDIKIIAFYPTKYSQENKLHIIPDKRITIYYKKESIPPELIEKSPEIIFDKPIFAINDIIIPNIESYELDENMLLADKIIEKTGIKNIEFNKITNTGLKFVSKLSSDRIQFSTNEEGEVTALAFETGFLGFSIPFNKK